MSHQREEPGSAPRPQADQPFTETRRRFLAAVAAVAGTVGFAGRAADASAQTQAGGPDCSVRGRGRREQEADPTRTATRGYLVRDRTGILYFVPADRWEASPGTLAPEFELPWIMQPQSNTNVARLLADNFYCQHGGRRFEDLPEGEPFPDVGRPETMFEIFGK